MKKEIKTGEIEVIEANSIDEAEVEYFKRIEAGCWQMHKAIKLVWSWSKLKYVAQFSMKKVEKAYHLEDWLKDIDKALKMGCEAYASIVKAKEYHKKIKNETH